MSVHVILAYVHSPFILCSLYCTSAIFQRWESIKVSGVTALHVIRVYGHDFGVDFPTMKVLLYPLVNSLNILIRAYLLTMGDVKTWETAR